MPFVPPSGGGGGSGTVTEVSVTTANGVSGSVANATTTPAISLTLGAITPTTVNGNTITTGTGTLTLGAGKTATVSNTLTFTGTDSSSVAFGAGGTVLYNGGALGTPSSGTATNLSGTASGLTAGAVTGATLTTALTVNTGTVTLTGNVANTSVLTIGAGAVSVSGSNTGDQTSVSGNAGTATALATARAIYGNNFDGTADLTQVIASTYGGTGNGFTKFSGPTTAEKTFTLPDASSTLLYAGGDLGTPSAGVLTNCTGLPTAGLVDDAVNLAKMAAGTAGNLITYDASGNPAAVATGTATHVLTSNGAGAAPTFQAIPAASFSWGSSASGTTDGGLSLTLSNSSDDAAAALKLTAGNTQANQPVLANLQIGTSGNVMGMMIQGTGSGANGGAVGTGRSHLTIWGDTANNENTAISFGNETSFGETLKITNSGRLTWGNGSVTGWAGANTIMGTGGLSSNANWTGYFLDGEVVSSGGLTVRSSGLDFARLKLTRSRSNTSGTLTDNFNILNLERQNTTTGAGGTLNAQGAVLNLSNGATQTAGTLVDTVTVLKITQDADSTGSPILITQNAVVSTNFKKYMTLGATVVWCSDGSTSPNTALSGSAGDICLNGDSGNIYRCTGTTNWTAM